MERSMLNITYKDRRTNIWVRERTKLIDIIYTVRKKMKWCWAGHINRLTDDRWTSRVTTWRPYDKKIRQGRPAKRWRDDLDKYWSDTIWQRTAQDRVIWRRHAEAFAQPRDTTAALWWWWWWWCLEKRMSKESPLCTCDVILRLLYSVTRNFHSSVSQSLTTTLLYGE